MHLLHGRCLAYEWGGNQIECCLVKSGTKEYVLSQWHLGARTSVAAKLFASLPSCPTDTRHSNQNMLVSTLSHDHKQKTPGEKKWCLLRE